MSGESPAPCCVDASMWSDMIWKLGGNNNRLEQVLYRNSNEMKTKMKKEFRTVHEIRHHFM